MASASRRLRSSSSRLRGVVASASRRLRFSSSRLLLLRLEGRLDLLPRAGVWPRLRAVGALLPRACVWLRLRGVVFFFLAPALGLGFVPLALFFRLGFVWPRLLAAGGPRLPRALRPRFGLEASALFFLSPAPCALLPRACVWPLEPLAFFFFAPSVGFGLEAFALFFFAFSLGLGFEPLALFLLALAAWPRLRVVCALLPRVSVWPRLRAACVLLLRASALGLDFRDACALLPRACVLLRPRAALRSSSSRLALRLRFRDACVLPLHACARPLDFETALVLLASSRFRLVFLAFALVLFALQRLLRPRAACARFVSLGSACASSSSRRAGLRFSLWLRLRFSFARLAQPACLEFLSLPQGRQAAHWSRAGSSQRGLPRRAYCGATRTATPRRSRA